MRKDLAAHSIMKNDGKLPKDLLRIVSEAIKNKIYGSVEIYFEAGNVTQITHRVINKISNPKFRFKRSIKVNSVKEREEASQPTIRTV